MPAPIQPLRFVFFDIGNTLGSGRRLGREFVPFGNSEALLRGREPNGDAASLTRSKGAGCKKFPENRTYRFLQRNMLDWAVMRMTGRLTLPAFALGAITFTPWSDPLRLAAEIGSFVRS